MLSSCRIYIEFVEEIIFSLYNNGHCLECVINNMLISHPIIIAKIVHNTEYQVYLHTTSGSLDDDCLPWVYAAIRHRVLWGRMVRKWKYILYYTQKIADLTKACKSGKRKRVQGIQVGTYLHVRRSNMMYIAWTSFLHARGRPTPFALWL